MSTIASPRDPRRPAAAETPTSSGRPSLDSTSAAAANVVASPPMPSKRSNRAALREYYKLRTPAARIEEIAGSEVAASDLDAPDFNADEYVAKMTATSGLQDLLRLYTQVVGEVRALDAEKKALVYDNYNKLITATETIRKMRANMDPLNPMASTLDPAIAQIYAQAFSIRDKLRQSVPAPDSDHARRKQNDMRTRELAAEVLATPARLRRLVGEGKLDEARQQWEMPRRLLETWLRRGIGGPDVQAVMDEGDAALKAKSDGSSGEGKML